MTPVPGDDTKRQKAELAYVLGSVLGSKGCVLASAIGSTETWENVRDVFRMAFSKTKRAPDIIWVDDVQRWGGKLLALVTAEFGTTHTRMGQDWRHFKELMLSNMDRRHGQWGDLRREVEGLLNRLKSDSAEDPIAGGAELRDAVNAIFHKYTNNVENATLLLRGAKFKEQLTFDICTALGGALQTPQGPNKQWFNVDISRLQTSVGKHGIFTDQVQSLWETKLGLGPEYWEPVALVGEPTPDASQGTNIVEAFHSSFGTEFRQRVPSGSPIFSYRIVYRIVSPLFFSTQL